MDNLLQNILTLSSEMATMREIIMNLKTVEKYDSLDIKIDDFKLLGTVKDLHDFDAKLLNEEEFSKGIKRCGCLGGRDYKEAVRRVLQKMLSHDVALQLTWNTNTNKTSIQSFPNVLLFIAVSVRSNPPFKQVLHSEIEDVIKRWLRYASDRNGGRMERMKKKTFSS